MGKCLNCETEIVQVAGRKTKVFCGTTCRVQYSRKKNKIEMVSIPKSQLDELLAGQEKIKELMAKTLGYSEERNGSPSNQSDTVKVALIETIADVAPSGLNQKNKPKKVVAAAKVPEAVESSIIDKKAIEVQIKEWEARKCPSYLNPLKFKKQKETAIQELKNKLCVM